MAKTTTARSLSRLGLLVALSSSALAFATTAPESVVCSRGSSEAVNACLATAEQPIVFPGERLEGTALRWTPVMSKDAVAVSASSNGETVISPKTAGIWRLERQDGSGWSKVGPDVVTRVHFSGGKALNGYKIGRHPGEGRGGKYAPPRYFIEVTKENADYAISKSLRLKQFLTKNQHDVWPKYLPLNVVLVDKLERVAQELRTEGFAVNRLHVMSGYRTPQYNGPGGNGRAKYSRHTYGDAADVWVDDDGDGVMDDLNKDGKVNHADAEYLAAVARRVEEKAPELSGGAGTYKANSAHGPFTHIDARGHAASWARK